MNERKVFQIDVGNMHPREAERQLERLRARVRQSRAKGQFYPLFEEEDIFVPAGKTEITSPSWEERWCPRVCALLRRLW